MNEGIQNTPPTAGADSIRSGYQIPLPRKGQVIFGKHVIPAFMAINAFLKLKVRRDDAVANADGTFTRGAKVAISDGNVLMSLTDAPGTSSGGGGAGNLNYRGTYDSSLTYAVGDIVRKMSGGSQGIWICVITNPTAVNPPTYPEPVLTGGTNYWDMWNFGIISDTVCSGGSKTQDFSASPPY